MPQVRDQINAQSAASNTAVNKKKAQGLTFRRFFTKPGVSPYSEVEWNSATPRSPTPREA